MGNNATRELASDNQPCRLKDINERLHQIMMDLIHESSTAADIAERREQHLKELQQQQQLSQMHQHAFATATGGNSKNNNVEVAAAGGGGGGVHSSSSSAQHSPSTTRGNTADNVPSSNNNGNDQQQQQDPYAPQPIPTLGIAVELRNKSVQAGTGEQIETIHRIWVALTLPGLGLGDDGAKEAASALERAGHLEFLDLAYNDITTEGLVHLCPAISASDAGKNCLRFLRLSGNQVMHKIDRQEDGMKEPAFSAEAAYAPYTINDSVSYNLSGVKAVAELLEKSPMVQEVQLFNCGITDEGVHALVNGLKCHDNIRYINLARNPTTRKSILMLTELVKRCKTLLAVEVDAEVTKQSDYANLEAALEVNRAEAERREEHRRVLEQKRIRRDAQQKEEDARRDEEAREERLRVEAQIREKQAEQRQHEEYVRNLEAVEREKEALTKARRERQRAAESTEAIENAMSQAFQWRDKLGVSTGKSAIYQDGFALYTRQVVVERDGSTREVMTEYDRNPNRLKACWCDPSDAAAPYARKLHYHCKYENANVDLLGSAKDITDASKFTSTDLPKYRGCCGTGHICASVGYYTKSLPNKSAAHFFSSEHPSYHGVE